MQTFIPFADFNKSARVLDNKRLGNQRLEGSIILEAATTGNGWTKHLAVQMWIGYDEALKLYINSIIREWVNRGFVNNMDFLRVDKSKMVMPPWVGDERVHASHRAALLHKSEVFYGRYGWAEKPELNYWWPTREGKDEYKTQ